ncbi:MAG: hypothetical protein IPH78_11600 [Bacteroidetes bacterium]|nr:hypothetical protein [Bacteroidota bacterium]
MNLKFYIPPNKQLPFDSIRLGYSTSAERKVITTPPFGKPVIILFLNPNSVNNYGATANGLLLGQHTQPLMLNLNENFKVMAIHLKPYALKQLLDIDASQLTNKYISMNGIVLLETLYELVLNNMADEKRLIEAIVVFFDSVVHYPVSHETTTFLNYIASNPPSTISKMVKEIGLTERNLERKFKTEVGLSPKSICRLLGFLRFLEN